ncbi:hypothetical protein D9613_001166 [Agrocybe pediades]|uniref:F-box domain-containing protein n=1 Tax=Agrocybe pediades TaxID=84607 RepID=A0A8H4R138_9AGAR|nr:hypothetical protein D9613_001166 [Agrocybe pediades]
MKSSTSRTFKVKLFRSLSKKPSDDVDHNGTTRLTARASVLDAPSSVHHLLQNNIPPTDEEVSLVLEFVTKAQQEELELRNSIHPDSPRLSRIVAVIQEHQAILSVVRRLPVEILQSIFACTAEPPTPLDEYEEIHSSLGAAAPSLSFSRVSQYWRAAALSCPPLWRRLPHIDLDKNITMKTSYLEKLKIIVLERTGGGPFDFHLTCQTTTGASGHPVFDFLLALTSRWRRVRLNLPFQTFFNLDTIFKTNHLACLDVLIAHVVDGSAIWTASTHDNGGMTVKFFKDAWKLRRVSIYGAYPPGLFGLPSSNLVEYQQELWHHPQQSLIAFQSYATLRRLSIFNFVQPHGPWPAMTFPELVYLRISFKPPSFHETFFSSVVLPRIEELEVSTSHVGRIVAPLLSLIKRSATPSKLKKLCWKLWQPGAWVEESNQLAALLRLTPCLTHLNIPIPSTEDIQLLADCTRAPLTPLLKTLQFNVNEGQHLSTEFIREVRLLAESLCSSDASHEDGSDDVLGGNMLTVHIHLCGYHPGRDYVAIFNDRNVSLTDVDNSDLLDLMIALSPYHSRRQKGSGVLNKTQRKTALSLLLRLKDRQMVRPSDVVTCGIYETIEKFKGHEDEKIALFSNEILETWDRRMDLEPEEMPWVVYNSSNIEKSLMYMSKTNPIRARVTPSKLVHGIRTEDCHPHYQRWPRVFI